MAMLGKKKYCKRPRDTLFCNHLHNSHPPQQDPKSRPMCVRINYIQFTDTISDIYRIIKIRKCGLSNVPATQIDILLNARMLTTFLEPQSMKLTTDGSL